MSKKNVSNELKLNTNCFWNEEVSKKMWGIKEKMWLMELKSNELKLNDNSLWNEEVSKKMWLIEVKSNGLKLKTNILRKWVKMLPSELKINSLKLTVCTNE